MIKVGIIYAFYGDGAGAELFLKKYLIELDELFGNSIALFIFCNKEGFNILSKYSFKKGQLIYVPFLDNQLTKFIWIEFISSRYIKHYDIRVFWIPSGSNHFPGRWNIPSVITFHDFGEYYVKYKYDFFRSFYRKQIAIKKSVKRGSFFCSVSKTTAKDLKFFWGKDSEVIYPGYSPHHNTFYEWNSKPQALKVIAEECNIFLDKPFVLTVGRTDYIGKGLDIAIDGIQNYNTTFSHKSLKLVLCGPEGIGHHKLKKKIKKDSSGDILYLGRVSDRVLDALYYCCEMVIFPSRFEGFGFPVLETYQHEKPLIISDGGSLPEVAGKGALIFKVGNHIELSERIRQIVENEKLKELLLIEGRKRLKDFSWEKSFNQMFEIFKKQMN